MPRRALYWWQSRDVGVGEIVLPPALIVGALALRRLTDEQIRGISTYRQMDAVVPMAWWYVAALVVAAFIIGGTLLHWRAVSAFGFLLSSVFWATIGLIIWRVTDTLLTPTLYAAFAIGSAKRAGELFAYGRSEGYLWKRS